MLRAMGGWKLTCHPQILPMAPPLYPNAAIVSRILQIVPWEANARKGREFAQRLHHELEARDYKSCQAENSGGSTFFNGVVDEVQNP